MSGDVQPRKRKDKKKKKDDLGIEEPRGTAAALGEGDVFMHSQHEHGTGGHWCAKVIFFSLLAVLVTLIGLIILENRGLSDLEANSVESRYSGVLEGWIEEGHDDDHHDEHTLELNHHDDEDDDDDDVSGGVDHGDHDDEDEEGESHEVDEDEADDQNHDDDDESNQNNDDDDDDDENQDDDDESNQDEDDDDEKNLHEDNDDESSENKEEQNEADEDDADSQQVDDDRNSEEQNLDTAEDEDEVEEPSYRRYYRSVENRADDDDDDDDDQKVNEVDDDDDQSVERNSDDDDKPNEDDDSQENDNDEATNNDSNENDDDDNDEDNEINENSDENKLTEDDEDHTDHDDHSEDEEVELEHIEEEIFDDGVSTEAPARKGQDSEEASKKTSPVTDADDDEVELLEPDEFDDLPEELPIPVPKGRPLVEVEDTPSTEKPQDTLAEEEEYERQQEALRKEKEQASQGMWLKIVVGGALLVATQAVLRRATGPPRESDDEVSPTREETPLSDRRMTLIAEPVPPPVSSKPQEVSRPVVEKEIVRQAPVVKSAPPPPPEDDEDEEIIVTKDTKQGHEDDVDRELYSDEEEEVEEEEEEEPEEPPKPLPKLISLPKEPPKTLSKPISLPNEPSKPLVKETPKVTTPPKVVEKEPTPEDDEDDVEIIEEEDIGEDLEEEEEEISDVDDVELLNRLEAKYGRLPNPDASRKKEGGNSIEDEWPGEPSDAYWRDEIDGADRDLRQGEWSAAAERAGAPELRASARARYVVARARDAAAEAQRDNNLLSKAIAAYLDLLKMNEKLSDKKLIEVADRTLDRMKFRGNYMGTEPIYRLLIRRFPDNPMYQNNLTVAFLMANRVDLAEEVIKEILKRWPDDRLALAHHGFILKTLHNKLEEAVVAFTKALEGDAGPANEPRFYYHFGDSLLLLGRFKEAHEVHKRGAKLGHFLSPAQRSLYNVDRLKSQPWWDVMKTPYARLAKALEKSWKEILKEGRAAQALYEKEKEGLKERGEWSQLDLFVRGREVPNRCARAPVTCGVVRSEVAASGCRRGQVKFSAMEAGTHVRPHVGPTNCRLRMHLGLSNTKDTFIRVDQEIRQWQTGKVLMFDDSFEHEVWHNGTGPRLVLIVDVWHPDLTRTERAQLPAI